MQDSAELIRNFRVQDDFLPVQYTTNGAQPDAATAAVTRGLCCNIGLLPFVFADASLAGAQAEGVLGAA